jgi:hypothetical protein
MREELYAQKIELTPVTSLSPYSRNARRHSKAQIKQIAKSIETFGFTNPVLTGSGGEILAGHGRVEAARLLGMEAVPTIPLAHLTEAEKRAYVLADNKLALNANWDQDMLAIELQELIELNFDVELTGFSIAETDFVIEGAKSRDTRGKDRNLDAVPPLSSKAVNVRCDLWHLGHHRLVCGDARAVTDFELLMSGEKADLIFTDPPYNVKIDGNVGGLGAIKHREFAFASGEMTEDQFTTFLALTLSNCTSHAVDGAIAFVCMDWRHMRELLDAGTQAFSELKNLCVWNKTNGGMGTFYRSKHELVFVYKVGSAPHTNSFELGQSGRYRTNVWDYAGISSLGATRANDLAMHPTVKPVALLPMPSKTAPNAAKSSSIVLAAQAPL